LSKVYVLDACAVIAALSNEEGSDMASSTIIVSEITKEIFAEAGRLKANYRISLADAFVLAQTKVTEGILLTSDHHEFDVIEANEPIRFLWIR